MTDHAQKLHRSLGSHGRLAATSIVGLSVLLTIVCGCAAPRASQPPDFAAVENVPPTPLAPMAHDTQPVPITQAVRRLPPLQNVLSPPRDVQLASHETPVVAARFDPTQFPEPFSASDAELVPPAAEPMAEVMEPMPQPAEDTFVVDLATALRLAGCNSLQIQLARERVFEAHVNLKQARAAILPSLWLGAGYTRHDGRIQATEGEVIEADRQSLFLGGGAGLDGAPVAGGAGGPARLFVNLSLADAHFEPLVHRQLFSAANAAEVRDTNDTMLEVASAYFNLIEARSQRANAHAGLAAAEKLLKLTSDFLATGQGAKAEVYRATTERAFWQRSAEDARRRVVQTTAELGRLLRLDGGTVLVPAEDQLAAVELVRESTSVEQLVCSALCARPELARNQAVIQARLERLRQEQLRPWLPYIQIGASAGAFEGGPSSNLDNQGGRSDVDVLAVWELKNLGYGNLQMRHQRASQLRQTELATEFLEDKIVAQVITAAADVASYRRQIDSAEEGLGAANQSYQANLDRIRDAVGLPLELVQAIRARTEAQDAYAQAVSDYNRAQYRLLHALGQPPLADEIPQP